MNRIQLLRKEKNITMAKAAKELGLPYTTYVNYEKEAREPNSETLKMIADYFYCTIDYLLGRSDSREVNETNKTAPIEGFDPPPKTVKKPRLGVISCGEPLDTPENFDGYDDVPENIRCDFTLCCEGDSMIGARIKDGDIVYIRQQEMVENGQIAAVLVDGTEKLLKRVIIKQNRIILQAENVAYEPLIFDGEEMNRVSIIGRAVGFTSML